MITSLFPYPVCGRGTNRQGMKLFDHVRTCTEISKKVDFVSYHAANIYTFFSSSSTWSHEQKYLRKGCPYMLDTWWWCSLKTAAYPRVVESEVNVMWYITHAHVFRFIHYALVLSQFGRVHPKKQTKIFWFLNFSESKEIKTIKNKSKQKPLTQDLKWLPALCTCMV